jgi:phenylpropionate dioxygenase-like ring-hydroxylating dioxygenase large terminal subunit
MPVPDCPLAEDPDYHVIYRNKWVWKTTAARATENFFDQAHFAFIHRGILGDPSEPKVSEPTFQREQEVLHFQVEVPANKTIPMAHVRNYSVFRPFTIYQRKEQPDGQNQVFLNYSCPTSAKESARFLVIYRNGEAEAEPGSRVEDLQDLIHEQDRIIVERQRPEMLPLDLSEELHVKGPDSIAVAYRRFMKELGVDT